MKKVLPYLAILHTGIIVLCLISIMALFMGGGQSSIDLFALLVIEIISVPVAVASILFSLYASNASNHQQAAGRRIYDAMPQWLVFSALMLVALAAFGEVALIIVARATETKSEWITHAPLIAMAANAAAVCFNIAALNVLSGKTTTLSGRWTGEQ